MAERLQNDIRQIEGALQRLNLYSKIGNPVTKEAIDNVIMTIDPGNIPTDAMVEKILNVTAKYYGVTAEDIKSRKKTDNIANARHIACFIIRKITELPYDTIGGFIGRDHSTVMASISKVEINIKTKKNTDSDIKKITKEIKS
jgi:chromosomal replication initiator protein